MQIRLNRMKCKLRAAGGRDEIDIAAHPLSDVDSHRAVAIQAQIFPARAGYSPERTAGQTACPEEFLARARKVCGELKGAGLA